MSPFHPFVPPFTYFPDWDEVRDAVGRTVLRLPGAGSKGVDVENWRDAQSVRDRIGSHIAELMNRECDKFTNQLLHQATA